VVWRQKKKWCSGEKKKMNTFLYFGNASSSLSDWSKWNEGKIKRRKGKQNNTFCLKKKEIITCWLDVKHWQARMQERYYIFWMSWSVDSISSCRSLFFSFWASMSSAHPKTHAHTRSFIHDGRRWMDTQQKHSLVLDGVQKNMRHLRQIITWVKNK
jgi:hypothetical protein